MALIFQLNPIGVILKLSWHFQSLWLQCFCSTVQNTSNKACARGANLSPFGEIRRFHLEIGHSRESCRSVKKKFLRRGGARAFQIQTSTWGARECKCIHRLHVNKQVHPGYFLFLEEDLLREITHNFKMCLFVFFLQST